MVIIERLQYISLGGKKHVSSVNGKIRLDSTLISILDSDSVIHDVKTRCDSFENFTTGASFREIPRNREKKASVSVSELLYDQRETENCFAHDGNVWTLSLTFCDLGVWLV